MSSIPPTGIKVSHRARDSALQSSSVQPPDALMNRFAPLDVTLESLNVQLYADERIITHADGVGLYDGLRHLDCSSYALHTDADGPFSHAGKTRRPGMTMGEPS